jgi:hypothetical protein
MVYLGSILYQRLLTDISYTSGPEGQVRVNYPGAFLRDTKNVFVSFLQNTRGIA